MLKRIALMESMSSNLHSFLKKKRQEFITAGQEIPARWHHRTTASDFCVIACHRKGLSV
jgi:hypothetical protein